MRGRARARGSSLPRRTRRERSRCRSTTNSPRTCTCPAPIRVPDPTSRSTPSTAAACPRAPTPTPRERMSGGGRVLVAVLIGATLASLALYQRLKDAPSVIRRVKVERSFSPNGDGYRDVGGIRFMLTQPDVVTVTVLDAGGRRVRRLATARPVAADRK